jgi:hypothetical protein
MQQWEYLCLELPQTKKNKDQIGEEPVYHVYQVEEVLNSLGAEGWELAGVTVSPMVGVGPLVFLKRAKE